MVRFGLSLRILGVRVDSCGARVITKLPNELSPVVDARDQALPRLSMQPVSILSPRSLMSALASAPDIRWLHFSGGLPSLTNVASTVL